MPTYKLYYFPIRARGELDRLVFAAAGVQYEDIRIPFADWPNEKKRFQFQFTPVLEVDGKQLSQTQTIARYLAIEFGLAGTNKWEAAEADMYCGSGEDLLAAAAKINFEKDETRKAEFLKDFKETKGPSMLQGFEAGLSRNKTGSGYLVGKGLTYADLALVTAIQFIRSLLKADGEAVISKFPGVVKHCQKIEALPKIAAWMKKRPESNV